MDVFDRGIIAISDFVADKKKLGLSMEDMKEIRYEESLRAIFEGSVDPIFIKDLECSYVSINKACTEIFGIPEQEIVGRTDFDLFPNKVANEIQQVDKKVFQGKVVRKDVSRIICEKNYVFEISKVPLYDDEGKVYGLLGIARDITRRKYLENRQSELEIELLKEKRLSSIGHLASGIAHNLSNPLTAIIGRAQLLKLNMPDIEELDTIISQSKRIKAIIDNMNIKSCQEKDTSKKPLDLNELLSIELFFLEADPYFKHEIHKDFQFQDVLPLIEGVYGDFSQGFISIIRYSIDLMRNSVEKKLKVKTRSDKNFIYIDISDTGLGISKEVASKLFAQEDNALSFEVDSEENKQKFLRLSLYRSYRILKSYGIEVDVWSEIGKGTTFSMKIPYRETV